MVPSRRTSVRPSRPRRWMSGCSHSPRPPSRSGWKIQAKAGLAKTAAASCPRRALARRHRAEAAARVPARGGRACRAAPPRVSLPAAASALVGVVAGLRRAGPARQARGVLGPQPRRERRAASRGAGVTRQRRADRRRGDRRAARLGGDEFRQEVGRGRTGARVAACRGALGGGRRRREPGVVALRAARCGRARRARRDGPARGSSPRRGCALPPSICRRGGGGDRGGQRGGQGRRRRGGPDHGRARRGGRRPAAPAAPSASRSASFCASPAASTMMTTGASRPFAACTVITRTRPRLVVRQRAFLLAADDGDAVQLVGQVARRTRPPPPRPARRR